MTHACPCCGLRFAHTSELTDHARADHVERGPVDEGRLTVQAYPRRERPADEHALLVRLPH